MTGHCCEKLFRFDVGAKEVVMRTFFSAMKSARFAIELSIRFNAMALLRERTETESRGGALKDGANGRVGG